MTTPELILSLFPGIGLLDMAFEQEGFCIVRGPDLLWGGNIKRFHPPSGRFDGVIGGPPCGAFSPLRHLVRFNGYEVQEDLIPEFVRCIDETKPKWWVMENLPNATEPQPYHYKVTKILVRDDWVNGETKRLRAFWFGSTSTKKIEIDWPALHIADPAPTVLAAGFDTARFDAGGRRSRQGGSRARSLGYKTLKTFEASRRLQGLPESFDLPGWTVAGKIAAVGNGVPLAMGRAIAKAVKQAIYTDGY